MDAKALADGMAAMHKQKAADNKMPKPADCPDCGGDGCATCCADNQMPCPDCGGAGCKNCANTGRVKC